MNTFPRLLGGRYEVGEVLGRGGMAAVHVGRDTRLGRTVAIKMLRSDLARDPSFQARFRREAQSAAALNHPAVVAVYDSGEEPVDDGDGVPLPYIVMEYVEGRTLREAVTRGQSLPWHEALRITSGVLAALGYSHRAGIVHRDIKPANVMLTPSGDVKVMDFGIARAIADSSATMTQTQAVIGTAQYLSPEQARGETVDARSDLYSAGCLLYELLTGRPPFVADSPVAVAYQHVGEPPQPPSAHNPEVPHVIDAIVVHALVKDRTGRYQSAEEFRADVEAALAGRGVSGAALASAAALGGGLATAAATEAMRAGARFGGPAGATEALVAVPADAGTQRLAPVTEAGRGGARRGEPALPDHGRDDPARPNRAGLWVLLALLAAAVLAIGFLVLPSLLGDNTPPPPPDVRVANVVGKSAAEATTQLQTQGLTVKPVDAASPEVPTGDVMLQSPTDGTAVPPGTEVTITVSTGPETVQVPDLVGQSRADAKRLLTEAGLVLGEVTSVDSTQQDAGRVVSSNPAALSAVATKAKVAIVVSSGKVKVPNVIGQPLEQATLTLTEAGLTVDASTFVESTQPEGTVTDQTFSGKTVPAKTKIKLFISAPTPTPTPTDTGVPFTPPPIPPIQTLPPPA